MTAKQKQHAYFLLNELRKQQDETHRGIVELGINKRMSEYFYQISTHIGLIQTELTKIEVQQ